MAVKRHLSRSCHSRPALTPTGRILTVRSLAGTGRQKRVGDLEKLFTILIGVVAGLLLAARLGWKPSGLDWFAKKAPPTPAAAPPPAQSEPQAGAAAAASLSTRLHELESVYAPLASNYAHPRELEDQAQF